MFQRTQALYAALAATMGVPSLGADTQGSAAIAVGDADLVLLFAEDADSLLLACVAMELPRRLDYGRVLWLLRRNLYDSPLAPFRIACDPAGGIVVWGRVPVEGMDGAQLAALVQALAAEAAELRGEIAVADVS